MTTATLIPPKRRERDAQADLIAQLAILDVVLNDQNRRQAAEIRALQHLVAVIDRTLREAEPYDPTRPATWAYQELRNRLASARYWIAGQGPDGPGAAYPVDAETLRILPPLPPALRETA